MAKLKVTYRPITDDDGGAQLAEWDMGTELAAQLLNDINLCSLRPAPFRIDTEDYKVYWAGTILRVDINRSAVTNE